jgi:hypothetical protein
MSWYARLARIEEQRRAAHVVRVATNRLQHRQGVTAIIAANANGDRVRLDQRQDMEAALLGEAAHRSNQAANSPFLQEPLAALVGASGETEGAGWVLAGHDLGGLDVDPFARSMLQFFQAKENPLMSMQWSLERYTTAWKRVREQTSSSPFSPHIGHYKAALFNHELHLLHSRMAWLPYITGFSPKRWQQAVGVVIYKQPENINMDRMRGIQLFAADYNLNNKILGREMMAHAERQGLVAPEQYGSRKGHSAIAHALNKQVAYSLVRVLRSPAAMCSNDAQGCYDRIVHSVASLSMQRVGVPLPPIMSMFTTLQSLQQCVRVKMDRFVTRAEAFLIPEIEENEDLVTNESRLDVADGATRQHPVKQQRSRSHSPDVTCREFVPLNQGQGHVLIQEQIDALEDTGRVIVETINGMNMNFQEEAYVMWSPNDSFNEPNHDRKPFVKLTNEGYVNLSSIYRSADVNANQDNGEQTHTYDDKHDAQSHIYRGEVNTFNDGRMSSSFRQLAINKQPQTNYEQSRTNYEGNTEDEGT